jgi:hypothetical protein
MFSFVKKKLAIESLDETAKIVVKRLEGLTPTERAETLALSNALMLVGAKVYGAKFAAKPIHLEENIAIEAVLELRGKQQETLAAAPNLEGMSAANPIFNAFKRELSSLEVVMVTAGASFHPASRQVAPKSWRLLASSTPFAKYAVESLLLYQKTHSLEAVVTPNGDIPDAAHLYQLATTLPPLFRPKGK